jgi:hypothetical protein
MRPPFYLLVIGSGRTKHLSWDGIGPACNTAYVYATTVVPGDHIDCKGCLHQARLAVAMLERRSRPRAVPARRAVRLLAS